MLKTRFFVKGKRKKKSLLLFSATSRNVTLHLYSAAEASLISNKIIRLDEKSGAPWAIFWCWLKNENKLKKKKDHKKVDAGTESRNIQLGE